MTDISTLKTGDRIVCSNGHEAPVVKMIDADDFLNICFMTENEAKLSIFFRKETGEAPGTHYEIAKVISNGFN